MMAAHRNSLVALSLLPVVLLTFATATCAADLPKLAGSWTWSWKDKDGKTHRHLLEVEGIGTKLAARERFDDLSPVPVSQLKLDGKQVHFSVVRNEHRADYTGVVADADTINGTVLVTNDGQATEFVWKATRQKPKLPPAEVASPEEPEP